MSEIILLGSQYSEKIILHVFIRLSLLNPSTCLQQQICYGNLQYKNNACY